MLHYLNMNIKTLLLCVNLYSFSASSNIFIRLIDKIEDTVIAIHDKYSKNKWYYAACWTEYQCIGSHQTVRARVFFKNNSIYYKNRKHINNILSSYQYHSKYGDTNQAFQDILLYTKDISKISVLQDYPYVLLIE